MWMEKALHIALGKERVEEIKLNYPIGLTLPAEACVTRWRMPFAGAAQSTVNLLIYSGTPKTKFWPWMPCVRRKALLIKYDLGNVRVGRAMSFMVQPDFILRLNIVQFLEIFVCQSCLAASPHRHECAMTKLRGVGSIVRVVLWVLKLGIWVASPFKYQKTYTSTKMKKLLVQLGHRGATEVELVCSICTKAEIVKFL